MPNWCDNSVRLSHSDRTKVDALEQEMSKKGDQGQSLAEMFHHLRPNPSGEWQYDWSCENWGTKWEADIIDWERYDDDTIWVSFNTAWAPPIALYDYLVEEGWEIEAFYHESGCAFCGKYTNDDGEEYYEYDFRDRETLEALPSDLEDFTGLLDYHDSCKADGEFDDEEEVD